MDLPEKAKVGVGVINAAPNGKKPLKVEFEDLQITRTGSRFIHGWGEVTDAAGESRVTVMGNRVAIQVPAAPDPQHWQESRILQEVTGDFVVQVKIAGTLRAKEGAADEWLSQGLLVWKDSSNLIRLERVSNFHLASKTVRGLCNLWASQDGQTAVDKETHGAVNQWYTTNIFPDALTILRLERRRGLFYPSYSLDGGQTWWPHVLGPFAMDLPDKVKVGVAVTNSAPNSKRPLTLEFEELRVTPVPPVKPRILTGWGEVEDPFGHCQVTAMQGKLAIEVPGKWYFHQWAPRILQEIEGDFVAQVKVSSTLRSEVGTRTLGQVPPWQSACLLIWQDRGNYLYLDRASAEVQGKILPVCALDAVRNGKSVLDMQGKNPLGMLHEIPDRLTHLRLERRQGKIYASFSQDGGKTWQLHSFGPIALELPKKVRVGVAAVNTTTKPLKVEFEDWQIMPAAGAK
jgi:regulation of enolase protein 1 (concanavalin A-like superfamily)